jgi:CBS domain-containing protein
MPESSAIVGDVMSTSLVTISPDASVTEAAALMRDEDISALLIPTTEVGIVTSTDVIDTVAQGLDPDDTPVSAVMTEGVETVPPGIRLSEAAAMMENFGISHLPVVDDDFVGMVSSTDITAELS